MTKTIRFIELTQANIHRVAKLKGDVVIIAYKVSRYDGSSPTFPEQRPVLTCKPDANLRIRQANTNFRLECAPGVNVGTKDWCQFHYGGAMRTGVHKLWKVAFRPADIACVPTHTDGKIRLYRCRVLEQVQGSML